MPRIQCLTRDRNLGTLMVSLTDMCEISCEIYTVEIPCRGFEYPCQRRVLFVPYFLYPLARVRDNVIRWVPCEGGVERGEVGWSRMGRVYGRQMSRVRGGRVLGGAGHGPSRCKSSPLITAHPHRDIESSLLRDASITTHLTKLNLHNLDMLIRNPYRHDE